MSLERGVSIRAVGQVCSVCATMHGSFLSMRHLSPNCYIRYKRSSNPNTGVGDKIYQVMYLCISDAVLPGALDVTVTFAPRSYSKHESVSLNKLIYSYQELAFVI